MSEVLVMHNSNAIALSEYKAKLKDMPLSQIAIEVRRDWEKVYFGAKPYLDAMASLHSVNDSYGMVSGRGIVMYFLSNARTWKGDKAKAVKAELNRRILK